MGIRRRLLATILAFAMVAGSGLALATPASAASVKVTAGAKCSVAKKQVKVAKTTLVCKKTAKGKLVWTKASSLTIAPVAPVRATPLTIVEEQQPAVAASTVEVPLSPSGYPVVIDPNAGGSNEVVIRTPEEAEAPVASNPVAPSNLRVLQLGDHAITVTHDAVDGVSQYQVYLRQGDSFSSKGTDVSNLNVEFTELTADWDYVICAYYRQDNVDSNKTCINVHTTGQRPVEPVIPQGPSFTSLSATEDTITASWNPIEGASWYYLCLVRDTSWGCGGYRMLTANSAIFENGAVYAGWQYGVQITAVFADGTRSQATMGYVRSAGSQPPPPTKYPAPTNLRIVDLTPTTVTIAWDDPANSPVSFWSVVTRYLTSYSQTGVDANARQFTSTAIWPGAGFELILSGFDQVNGKWTAETRIGFFAPAAN
jgi:hypothetical protein